MLEIRPVSVYENIVPQPRVLLLNHWVSFSNKFPESLDHVKGKTFRISRQQQVSYSLSYILKEACYKDVNLSNEDTGEKLYPDASESLYEVLIGMRPGSYRCIPYFPADQPINRLDYPTMTPVMADSTLKFIGSIRPEDSPPENPVFKLYLVFKLKPIMLRLWVEDGVEYEKATLDLLINRCTLSQESLPSHVTPKNLLYLDEVKGIV